LSCGTVINSVSLKANLQKPNTIFTCNTELVGDALPAWMQVLEQCREQLPVAFHGSTPAGTRITEEQLPVAFLLL